MREESSRWCRMREKVIQTHRMHEEVAKIKWDACKSSPNDVGWVKSGHNDVGCMKKSPRWSRMRKTVVKMISAAWKSRQTDVGCVKKSPKWRRVHGKVIKFKSDAWKINKNEIGNGHMAEHGMLLLHIKPTLFNECHWKRASAIHPLIKTSF